MRPDIPHILAVIAFVMTGVNAGLAIALGKPKRPAIIEAIALTFFISGAYAFLMGIFLPR